MDNTSSWLNGIDKELFPKLSSNIKTDVVIIGGGIAGITTAYLLAHSGMKVIVIDKESLLSSVTAYTTAFLTRIIDTDTQDLLRGFGTLGTRTILEAGERAIDFVEETVKKENIECEFERTSYIEYATSKKGYQRLKEDAQVNKKLGFKSIVHPNSFLSFNNFGSVEIEYQAKFHPLKYLVGLQNASVKMGVKFFNHTEVTRVEGGEEGKLVVIYTKDYAIEAQKVVIATHNPFMQPFFYLAKKGMYKSYVYEFEIQKNSIPVGMYADDHNPYHYFRIDRGENGDRMIVGGEDHRRAIPISENRNFHALLDYSKKILGTIPYTIKRKWAGPILEPSDGIPLIGEYSKKYPNRLVLCAFSGNGMTWGTYGAMVLRDLILGETGTVENMFDPSRKIPTTMLLKKARDYTGEFIHGALKNFFISKRKSYHKMD